jgi:hypothetical protein
LLEKRPEQREPQKRLGRRARKRMTKGGFAGRQGLVDQGPVAVADGFFRQSKANDGQRPQRCGWHNPPSKPGTWLGYICCADLLAAGIDGPLRNENRLRRAFQGRRFSSNILILRALSAANPREAVTIQATIREAPKKVLIFKSIPFMIYVAVNVFGVSGVVAHCFQVGLV